MEDLTCLLATVRTLTRLTTGKNEKNILMSCHRHEIYREEAVGLKNFKYTLKITIFVNMRIKDAVNIEDLTCLLATVRTLTGSQLAKMKKIY